MNFFWFVVSKVLLTLIVVFQLLGRLGHKWVLFLESPSDCVVYSDAVLYFTLAI